MDEDLWTSVAAATFAENDTSLCWRLRFAIFQPCDRKEVQGWGARKTVPKSYQEPEVLKNYKEPEVLKSYKEPEVLIDRWNYPTLTGSEKT